MRGDPIGAETIGQVRALSKRRVARFRPSFRDLYRFRGAFRERRGLAHCQPVERGFKRRNLAAGRRLSPDGPWRCRDADVDAARPRFPVHIGRAWSCILLIVKNET